jgi:hypothetical protein
MSRSGGGGSFSSLASSFFVSIVDDSAQDFLGDDFTALDFVDLAMMNKIYVRNEERDDNEGRGKER